VGERDDIVEQTRPPAAEGLDPAEDRRFTVFSHASTRTAASE
jgi:hypothetical protein